jgi:protein-ribulosamine 3-kinase
MILEGLKIVSRKTISAGIHTKSEQIRIDDGAVLFLKSAERPTTAFREETYALKALDEHRAIRCPKVLEHSNVHLLTEWIDSTEPTPEFWNGFGFALARLHIQLHDHWGWPHDNHIGATPQSNAWLPASQHSWSEFFISYRLRPMIDRLSASAPLTDEFQRAVPAIRRELDAVKEPPSLLHGDLWSGNFLCDSAGQAVLIDPASYFGHREADLAMTELFGGFASEFYESYEREFPLQPGYTNRRKIYNLYHLLNHWLLFGTAYRQESLGILKSLTNPTD